MAPRVMFGPGARYPVGEWPLAGFGCLATFALPVWWALRAIWRGVGRWR
jgi:hypothetical protein